MSVLIWAIDGCVYLCIAFRLLVASMMIHKLWLQRHSQDVYRSISVPAQLMMLSSGLPLLCQRACNQRLSEIVNSLPGLSIGMASVLIGSGLFLLGSDGRRRRPLRQQLRRTAIRIRIRVLKRCRNTAIGVESMSRLLLRSACAFLNTFPTLSRQREALNGTVRLTLNHLTLFRRI